MKLKKMKLKKFMLERFNQTNHPSHGTTVKYISIWLLLFIAVLYSIYKGTKSNTEVVDVVVVKKI